MKCNNCPLKDSDVPCVAIENNAPRLCTLVDQGYKEIIVKRSLKLLEKKDEPLPNLGGMASNLFDDLLKWTKSGFETVSEEVLNSRISICESCPHFRSDRRCSICGCYVNAKARLASSECPDNPKRWEATQKDYKKCCS